MGESKKKSKLSRAEQEYFDNRVSVKSATVGQWNDDRERFVLFTHRSERARYTIRAGGTKVSPTGGTMVDQGLHVEFEKHQFILDSEDPEFDDIYSRMVKQSGDFGITLFNANEILKQGGKMPDRGMAGVNHRTQMEAIGVRTPEHLRRIMEVAGVTPESLQKQAQDATARAEAAEAQAKSKDDIIAELQAKLEAKGDPEEEEEPEGGE